MKRRVARARQSLALMIAIAIYCVSGGALVSATGNTYSSRIARSLAKSDGTSRLHEQTQKNDAGRSKITRSLGRVPVSFERNLGQADPRVKFIARTGGYNLFLNSTEMTFAFSQAKGSDLGLMNDAKTGSMRETINSQSQVCDIKATTLRMKVVGANQKAEIKATDELPGKSNYFIGSDPKKWRTGVPTYAQVRCEQVYPGIDLAFYGNRQELEYDFIVAPGADFKTIRIRFDGGGNISLEASGDIVIKTASGTVRQRKPIIYQVVDGLRQKVEGGFVIRSEREVGFDVGNYDRDCALVIDPVLVYATSIGGSFNESANAIAIDSAGNAYIAGMTTSPDFPTVNAFQPELGLSDNVIGIPPDAFVAKLNPSGTAFVYATYLGGGVSDIANGIAVDNAGNAYVTGFTGSRDFPVTSGAFQTEAVSGGSAFITRLNPAGNDLSYSTYLGGSGSGSGFSPHSANIGLAVAADKEGSAYVTGYTFSPRFPLKRAAQEEFNNGFAGSFGCLIPAFVPAPAALIDAFVTKLNPQGSALVYSTYLGGRGQDVASGIALDSNGNAYITGGTCSPDLPAARGSPIGSSDAFLTKLSASGRRFLYSVYFGGSGVDRGSGIAITPAGFFAITGWTNSTNLPVTQGAFQFALGSSAAYVTQDAGNNWAGAIGLPNVPVNTLAVDPLNSSTVYAGSGQCSFPGAYKSTDGGKTWRAAGILNGSVSNIAIDPKNSSTVYAGGSGLFKSTDGGNTWAELLNPGRFVSNVAIDPVNTDTIYAITGGGTCGDAIERLAPLKSTDGGATWNSFTIPTAFFVSSFAVNPQSPSTLYATSNDLYKSTDGGTTWRVPYEGHRSLVLLAIDPLNTATLYFRNNPSNINNLYKSTDGGVTFSSLGLNGVAIKDLAVDPMNSSILYAATGNLGLGGGVFKSTDGGATWAVTDLKGMSVYALAVDPSNSSRIYAGAYDDTDAFIATGATADGSPSYLTYLGDRGRDTGTGVGVDEAGSIYLTGQTFSDRFPVRDAWQYEKTNGPFATSMFVTKLKSPGFSLDFSTFLGGNEATSGTAIAADESGKVYVAGSIGTPVSVPSLNSTAQARSGVDAFVAKLASPPSITAVSISGKKLIVTGEGFDRGAVILVDLQEQATKNDESQPSRILVAKKAGKKLASGQRVIIQVLNKDGFISFQFEFIRR